MHNSLQIYRRKSPAGKPPYIHTHASKKLSTLKQTRTFQSWREKSTVEFKYKEQKRAEQSEQSIGALLNNLKTTISLPKKRECISLLYKQLHKPTEYIIHIVSNTLQKLTFKEINKVHASFKGTKEKEASFTPSLVHPRGLWLGLGWNIIGKMFPNYMKKRCLHVSTLWKKPQYLPQHVD